MSKLGNLGARLHRGEVGYDFVGKRFVWYGVSIAITVVAILGLTFKGLHMGIEFQGGAVFTTPKTSLSVTQTEEIAEEASGQDAIVQGLGTGGMRVQVAGIDTDKSDVIKAELAERLDVDPEQINAELVGPSWGEQIADKAWQGLAIFMVLVVIYLAIAFEWRMAVAALVALIHDITITVGIYALVGFEVTPGTVIGLLTILGYSLYDTVVVFDSLKEGTQGITKHISLSIFVGLAAGAYSSIFIATPLVADLKEREPEMQALRKRVLAKRAQTGEGATAVADADAADADAQETGPAVVGPRTGRSGRASGRRR
jgi:preprotein translocase subunit SecF